MKVNTVYVIYEYKKAPAVVKVNHLEQGSGTVLSPQETLNGIKWYLCKRRTNSNILLPKENG